MIHSYEFGCFNRFHFEIEDRFKDPDDEMIETETQELNQETKRNQQTQKSLKIEEQGIIVWVNPSLGCFFCEIGYFYKHSPIISYIREDTRNCL